MPKVNGMETIAYFRQEFPSVPVIVLTGEPELAGATHLFKQGIVDYLAKPISPEKLTQVVHKAVRDHVFNDPFMTWEQYYSTERNVGVILQSCQKRKRPPSQVAFSFILSPCIWRSEAAGVTPSCARRSSFLNRMLKMASQ